MNYLASCFQYDKHGRNASRNINKLIHRQGRTLEVPVSAVRVPIRVSARRPKAMINWPVLHLSSWLKTCCNTSAYSGFFFLSGRTIDQPEEIRGMLGRFWERHLKALEFAPPFPPASVSPWR